MTRILSFLGLVLFFVFAMTCEWIGGRKGHEG